MNISDSRPFADFIPAHCFILVPSLDLIEWQHFVAGQSALTTSTLSLCRSVCLAILASNSCPSHSVSAYPFASTSIMKTAKLIPSVFGNSFSIRQCGLASAPQHCFTALHSFQLDKHSGRLQVAWMQSANRQSAHLTPPQRPSPEREFVPRFKIGRAHV